MSRKQLQPRLNIIFMLTWSRAIIIGRGIILGVIVRVSFATFYFRDVLPKCFNQMYVRGMSYHAILSNKYNAVSNFRGCPFGDITVTKYCPVREEDQRDFYTEIMKIADGNQLPS